MAITKLDNVTDLSLATYRKQYSVQDDADLIRQYQLDTLNDKLSEAVDEINNASLENAYSASTTGIKVAEVTLTATQIVGTATGDLGHANGAVLVAAAGAGYVHEFISAVLIYDFLTGDYEGGGDDLVIQVGVNAAQVTMTPVILSADCLGAGTDKIVQVNALSASDQALTILGDNIISIKCTAYTAGTPTAAGTLKCIVSYRTHTTGL